MVSDPLEPSNWRLIERSSFTSVTKTVTKTSDPIDCDEPEIPEQTTTANNCTSQSFGTFENTNHCHYSEKEEKEEEDLESASSHHSDSIVEYPLRKSIHSNIDLALDTRRGPGRASGRGGGPPYAGPLPQREPPSPAQSRRTTITHPPQHHQFDTLESSRRPSVSKMHRTASTADISEYKINEGAIKLLSVSDLILLIASLVMVATGAGLMGFYRLHLLEIVTVEFLIVPLLMVVGGTFAFFTAVFGFYAASKEDACLLITHAVFMSINFCILLAAIISSIRLIFYIQTGLFEANVTEDMNLYEIDSWVRYRWDTLQYEFACCGGFTYNNGYQDWKHSVMGMQYNSVPDSCCLRFSIGCGRNIFQNNQDRSVYPQIFTHGCITIIERRIKEHVVVILTVYAAAGGILVIQQLLCIVLACCYANQLEKYDGDYDEHWDYDQNYSHSRPGTPHSMRYNNNETTF